MPIIVCMACGDRAGECAATGARGEGTPTIVFSPSGCWWTSWVAAGFGPGGAATAGGAGAGAACGAGKGGIGGLTACSTVWAPTLTGDDVGA
jgi:hypothetical protein